MKTLVFINSHKSKSGRAALLLFALLLLTLPLLPLTYHALLLLSALAERNVMQPYTNILFP